LSRVGAYIENDPLSQFMKKIHILDVPVKDCNIRFKQNPFL